jgi:hypothetical protein
MDAQTLFVQLSNQDAAAAKTAFDTTAAAALRTRRRGRGKRAAQEAAEATRFWAIAVYTGIHGTLGCRAEDVGSATLRQGQDAQQPQARRAVRHLHRVAV